MGGDASPPTSLKVTILAEKSASILNNSAPFRDASPPTDLNVMNPAAKSVSILVKTFFVFFFWRSSDYGRKKRLKFRFRPKNHSQFWWRPFFFFFFLETTWFWAKKTFEFPISAEKTTLNFGEDIRIFEVLASNPPPPKFSGSATALYSSNSTY